MDGLDNYICPPTYVLEEEEYISRLSETERELYFLRQDLFNGKIFRFDDEEYDSRYTCYEDALGCALFWALEDGKITRQERDRLYEKYK